MSLVTLKTMLTKAYQKGYAVGAFNVIDLTFLEAITDSRRPWITGRYEATNTSHSRLRLIMPS
jgi:hypothetical protein